MRPETLMALSGVCRIFIFAVALYKGIKYSNGLVIGIALGCLLSTYIGAFAQNAAYAQFMAAPVSVGIAVLMIRHVWLCQDFKRARKHNKQLRHQIQQAAPHPLRRASDLTPDNTRTDD